MPGGRMFPLSTDLNVDYEVMDERVTDVAPATATIGAHPPRISSPIMPRPPATMPSVVNGSFVPIHTVNRSPSSAQKSFKV